MSFDPKPHGPSVNERRGQTLTPLKTNFSRPTSQAVHAASARSNRPRPSEYDNNGKGERVPLHPAHVKRQTSRSSLRQLFSREKSTRKSTDSRLSAVDEAQNLVKQRPEPTDAPLSPGVCVTPKTTTSIPTLANSPTDDHKFTLNDQPRPSEDRRPGGDVAWKPPPLFQAYPQAIKHISLPAPVLSADSIVRLHATFKARETNLQDEDPQGRRPSNGEPGDDLVTRKKVEKERKKYLRALSENIEKGEWVEKVYVLATSGYILQYCGQGKHDRLPEKMLLLGPKSVAFASDAIPGRHWVLQVSQAALGEDSTARVETSRPLFSRLGFHKSHARRSARNFLLVFNSPEELSSWLLAVRAQIEARGGKKYVSERVFDDGMEHQLKSPQSTRQLVKKDPNRFSAVFVQPPQSAGSEEKELSVGEQPSRNSYMSLHRRSMVMHSATESRSESVSTVQTEVISTSTIDDSSHIYTVLASPPLPDGSAASDLTSSNAPPSPTFSNPKKRRSLYLPHVTSAEIAQIPRAQSTVPETHARSTSPPAPNFSVPSFSRRFAARPNVPQIPRLPSASSDQVDDASTDTMSMLSSPPLSPSIDINGVAQKDILREQRRVPSRQEVLKRQIRASNSEDSLGLASRDQDRNRLRYSRTPSGSNIRSSFTPVQPAVANGLPAEASTEPKSPDNQRIRNSVYHQLDATPRFPASIMTRRKSLTGLSIGPPVAPPPNCPLPKIPSPFGKPSASSEWPQQSPPESPVDERRRSLAASPPRSTRSRLPHATSRQSRVAQGA